MSKQANKKSKNNKINKEKFKEICKIQILTQKVNIFKELSSRLPQLLYE
jgi:hypothetical protein